VVHVSWHSGFDERIFGRIPTLATAALTTGEACGKILILLNWFTKVFQEEECAPETPGYRNKLAR
jgi:hypothetical protein